jgi:hypothetical protein
MSAWRFTVMFAAACGSKDAKEPPARGSALVPDRPAPGIKPDAGAAASSCPPFSMTVDGVPVEGMTRGFAVRLDSPSGKSHRVDVVNHEDASCTHALDDSYVLRGAVVAGAYSGEMEGLALDASYFSNPPNVKLVRTTDVVGEPVELCMAPATLTPETGDFKGRKVAIGGRFSGTFCGVVKKD